MVSSYGTQLAVHLISSSYGDLCSKVCKCLLRRGTLTLAEIIRFTELTTENVKNCLRVLIHQNCVEINVAAEQGGDFGETSKTITQYVALFDNIIHKLRAPKFMQIVSDELGEDCLSIFQELIQRGRLSYNQIIDRIRQTTDSYDHEAVRNSFKELVNSKFIERCPAPEPIVAPLSESETPGEEQGAKFSKIDEERKTTEPRALAAAAPMESMRFLMEMDGLNEEEVGESSKSVKTGKKRNQDEKMLDTNKKKEVLWRVNYEELVCCLRQKACILYVKTRINNETAIVLRAILKLTLLSESVPKAEKSAYLFIKAIQDEILENDGSLNMDFENIRVSLDLLGCQDESYSVDLKRIIEMAQNDEVESVVLRRHGKEAYRIFRLLSMAGRLLETDKISDSTFIEKKDAIEILYKLWKDNYVHMEKVFLSGAKESLFVLWKVNKEPVREHVLDELYHALLNLRLRILHEQDQGKEVRRLPEEHFVGEVEPKYELLEKLRDILESSMMNIDDVIMLFHDF